MRKRFAPPGCALQQRPLYDPNQLFSAPAVVDKMEVKTNLRKSEIKQVCQQFKQVRLCLLYKASVHGFTAQAFHAKSDLQGPTVVVAYNRAGCVYGGYSSVGFRSKQALIRDKKAFLFRLNTGEEKKTLLKIPVKNPAAAIYDHSTVGPDFGNGSLCLLVNGNQVTSDATNDYEFIASDLHENDLLLTELEVYRLEDIGDTIEFPWRSVSWMVEERKRLLELAKNYKPAVYNIPHIRVLMIGPVGAGKSSFFNSLNSVFRGHVATQAVAGSDGTSVTKKYRTYSIKDGSRGKQLPIMLCDSMGLEEKNGTGLEIEDIPKILEGHVADRYQFNPAVSIQPDAPGYIKSPSLKDKIHAVVFVLDSCTVGILSEKLLEKLKQLRAKVSQYDVPHLVLLTKVDELCPAVEGDVRNVYRSRAVKEQILTVSSRLGIPISSVLPIKNYAHELELDESVDILILHAVQQIMRMADLYFDDLVLEEKLEQ